MAQCASVYIYLVDVFKLNCIWQATLGLAEEIVRKGGTISNALLVQGECLPNHITLTGA